MTQLTIDYANCLSDRIGEHGLDAAALQNAGQLLIDLTKKLNSSRGSGDERWRTLPFNPARRDHVKSVKQVVRKIRSKTKNLVVLGIGGSALGNIALQRALNPSTYNIVPAHQRRGPRLFVLDNVDPQFVGEILVEIQRSDEGLKRTTVNVISKSGETTETAAQFLIARSMLMESLGDEFARHIVAITDPNSGTLRELSEREGYWTLPIPIGVGGRFSVLSPVGLFSAAMCGNDINAILQGAAEMDERCQSTNIMANPAAQLAWILVELSKRGQSNHVLMPYCNALEGLADWFRQLWAESLGKRVDLNGNDVYAGATPIKALGATDQHSQIQLYREGPNDKVIGFLEIESFTHNVEIPSGLNHPSLNYLEGSSLGTILHTEKRATEYALVESQRPNFTIQFPELSEHTVGQFIQLWMITTTYAGLLLNINPFDQPAVETGKLATFGLMGREGYGEWSAKVAELLPPRT